MTTALARDEVQGWVRRLLEYRSQEAWRLDRIFQYLRDPDIETSTRNFGGLTNGPLRWLRSDVPNEVRRLAEMARVNMLGFVVNSTVESMGVDGLLDPNGEDRDGWEVWQRNRFDARQMAVHRSAVSYGTGYVTVLPGDPVPVLRGASPRKMTAVYGEDEDWPELALEERQSATKGTKLYRLYDAMTAWRVEVDSRGVSTIDDVGSKEHRAGVCPVVRFLSSFDDDGVVEGDVQGLIPLQDQINVTTFGLLVAQHWGAFRQRYIIGWTADSEAEALEASAKKLWTFEGGKDEIDVGEFAQTELSGYVGSREASLRHLATISQTPAHELLGQLVNLSADALAMAEKSHTRKVAQRETTFGEGWEQVFELAAQYQGRETSPMAYVRWRDTEARSMSQMVDALSKAVAGLGVPPQALWSRIPGVTQQEVELWKELAKSQDTFTQLNELLTKQTAKVPPPAPDAQQRGAANPEPGAPAAPAAMPAK